MNGLRVLASAFACCPPGKPGFGGGEDLLGWNLLKQIARFHQVWVLTPPRNRASIDEALREEPVPNIYFHYVDLPSRLRGFLRFQGSHQVYYWLWQIRAYFAARNLHRMHRFELFHHITYANDWMASYIGALLPTPYVRGPGGGAHRTPRGFEQEYTLGGRVWEKARTIGQWLFRHDLFFILGQGRAAAILVCTRESKNHMPSKWSGKVHLFPVNGISSADLELTASGRVDGNRFRVLSAGSLIRVKGFALAIKAFKKFADQYPETEFTIIGGGPEEPRLRAILHSLCLDTKVRMLPQMPRDNLLSKMASHDIFLFPSLRDGGGAVVIEAMAAGKPVVCLDTGGPGMHVTAESGVKIKPGSPESAVDELAKALERLYLDKHWRSDLGRAAKERAELEYHWDRLGERLLAVYQQAIDQDVGH